MKIEESPKIYPSITELTHGSPKFTDRGILDSLTTVLIAPDSTIQIFSLFQIIRISHDVKISIWNVAGNSFSIPCL